MHTVVDVTPAKVRIGNCPPRYGSRLRREVSASPSRRYDSRRRSGFQGFPAVDMVPAVVLCGTRRRPAVEAAFKGSRRRCDSCRRYDSRVSRRRSGCSYLAGLSVGGYTARELSEFHVRSYPTIMSEVIRLPCQKLSDFLNVRTRFVAGVVLRRDFLSGLVIRRGF